jgi:antitoxin component of MazEF toxin-antitoxin module
MTLTRLVRRIGGSLVVGVPSHFAECLDLAPGDSLRIEMQKKQIIMTPVTTNRQALQVTEAEQNTPERSEHIG